MRALLLALAIAGSATGAAAAAAPQPGFVGCRSFFSRTAKPVVRPRSIVFACADGNFYVTGIHWTRWGGRGAEGVGVGHENDCKPYCAAGHFHTYRLVVTLSGVARCGRPRRPQLTRASWRYREAKPRAGPRSGSVTFRCA